MFTTQMTRDGERSRTQSAQFEVVVEARTATEAQERAFKKVGDRVGGTPLSRLWEGLDFKPGVEARPDAKAGRVIFRKMTIGKRSTTVRL